jgi:hypothetical protein
MSDDVIERWMSDERINEWPIVHRSSIINSQIQSSIINHPFIDERR